MKESLRKVILISTSRAGDTALPSGPIAGWDIVRVRHLSKAKRLIEAQDIRVGLVHCECGPHREDPQWFEQLLEELEAEHLPVRWIALLAAHPPLDDPLRRLIGQHCFDFHTLPLDPPRLVWTLGHAYGMASLRCAGSPLARAAEAARAALHSCHEHKIIGASWPCTAP